MRFLLVALCLSALAIAARAQCNSNADCLNAGTCSNKICNCKQNVMSNGISTTYSGGKCEKMNSWWYTNRTNTNECSFGCQNGGDIAGKMCKCKTFFDGNVTTEYSGNCCQNYYWWWRSSFTTSTSSQQVVTSSNASAVTTSCNADTTCSGHGTCQNGGCVCSSSRTGNRTIEYYGPDCNSWMAFWWWYDSSSSSYSYMEVKGTGNAQSTLGYGWAADGVGMAISKQEWYCWCKNSSLPVAQQASGNCIASCNATLTCNGHGTCNSDHSCTCTGNFAGRWCDQCKPGFGNSKTSAGVLCDVCMPSFYPATGSAQCATYCIDDKHCNGRGKCDVNTGKCGCNPGYKGNYCEQCKEDEGFHNDQGSCTYCSGDAKCNSKGVCASQGTCACASGFTGTNCEKCVTVDPKQPWPKCAGAVAGAASKGGAAAGDDCEGPNLALPIILSILGTLIVMLIAFACYRMWAAKQAGAGGAGTAKSSNWSEFEKDSSTAYSQL